MSDFKSRVIMLFIVSIGFLIFGLGKTFMNYNFMKTTKETKATITQFQEVRKKTGRNYTTTYKTDIKYTVDKVSYTKTITLYKKDMVKSGSFNILYNPKNPTEILVDGYFGSNIYVFTGVVCLVISIISHIYGKTKYRY